METSGLAELSREAFRGKIKTRLEGLSRQQKVAFATRAELHALPFLAQSGEKGFLEFWKPKDRAKHLLAVQYIAAAAAEFGRGRHHHFGRRGQTNVSANLSAGGIPARIAHRDKQ
jgi:hypothetical protein